jgi:hypothetical protein
MKRNIRNLFAIVIITIIVPFMLVACATTSPSVPQAITGQYNMTGEGMCLLAPLGFKPNLTPSCTETPQGPACPGIIQSWSGEGVYFFNKDGTGSLTVLVQFVTESFRGPSGIVPSSAGAQKVSAKIHHNVTNEGKITITADPGTYTTEWISGPNAKKIYHIDGFARKGTVAPGGKTIIVNSLVTDVMSFKPPYVDLPPTAQSVCNGSAILIWQHD